MRQQYQRLVLEQQPQPPLTDVEGQCKGGQDRGDQPFLSLQQIQLVNCLAIFPELKVDQSYQEIYFWHE